MTIDTKGLVLAAFSFVGFAILIPPFTYHLKNKNIPACSLMFWFCFVNLTGFVNALIWSGDDYAFGPDGKGYCDLTVRINSGAFTGQLCATACLIFNLYMIIAAKDHRYLASGSKRKTIVNVLVCWFTPLLVMGVSILTQVNRYMITRYVGCAAAHKYGVGNVLLYSIWNVFWITVACAFAIATLYSFACKRRDIKDILRCTNSGLNMGRFARLLIFSLLIIGVLSPLVITIFVLEIRESINATAEELLIYKSIVWSEIYALDVGNSFLATRIVNIILSFITFLLFGLGTDALTMYRGLLVAVGFKNAARSASDSHIAANFSESRQTSRLSEKTDVTAREHKEYEDFKELVFEGDQLSLNLASTANASSPTYDFTSPDVGFEFRVNAR